MNRLELLAIGKQKRFDAFKALIVGVCIFRSPILFIEPGQGGFFSGLVMVIGALVVLGSFTGMREGNEMIQKAMNK